MPHWVYWVILGTIFYGFPMAYLAQIASNAHAIKGSLERIEATLEEIQSNTVR